MFRKHEEPDIERPSVFRGAFQQLHVGGNLRRIHLQRQGIQAAADFPEMFPHQPDIQIGNFRGEIGPVVKRYAGGYIKQVFFFFVRRGHRAGKFPDIIRFIGL